MLPAAGVHFDTAPHTGCRETIKTGVEQPDAIGLYTSEGYHQIECYGVYKDLALSRCFAKDL